MKEMSTELMAKTKSKTKTKTKTNHLHLHLHLLFIVIFVIGLLTLCPIHILAQQPAPEFFLKLGPQPKLQNVDYTEAAKFVPKQCNEEGCAISNRFLKSVFDLQYPPDCDHPDKKYLVCYPTRTWGFGSSLHHIAWCMSVGVALQRTVLLHSHGVFSKAADCPDGNTKGSWECFFQPVTHCAEPNLDASQKEVYEPGKSEKSNTRIIYVAKVLEIDKDPYAAWAPDYARNFLGQNAQAWTKGHLMWFLTRPNALTTASLAKIERDIGFKPPAVCLHVRRGDKTRHTQTTSKEAETISLDSYMKEVQNFLNSNPNAMLSQNGKGKKKRMKKPRLLLLTDDQSVIEEAKQKVGQQFTLLFHDAVVKSEPNPGDARAIEQSRNHYQSTIDLLGDVTMLSKCEFMVITFSSNIGRWAYELKFQRIPNAAEVPKTTKSMDGQYFYN